MSYFILLNQQRSEAFAVSQPNELPEIFFKPLLTIVVLSKHADMGLPFRDFDSSLQFRINFKFGIDQEIMNLIFCAFMHARKVRSICIQSFRLISDIAIVVEPDD